MTVRMLTPHLSVAEFACKHCGDIPHELKKTEMPYKFDVFFGMFETIRKEWDMPIRINSGFRCAVKNAQVGGAPLSIHLFGLALDLDCANEKGVEKMMKIIEFACPELRVGKYSNFVHIDAGYYISPRIKESWMEGIRWDG